MVLPRQVAAIAGVLLAVLFACSMLVYALHDIGNVITLDITLVMAPLLLLVLFVSSKRKNGSSSSSSSNGSCYVWRDVPRFVSVAALAALTLGTSITLSVRLLHSDLSAPEHTAHLLHAVLAALQALIASALLVVYARWLWSGGNIINKASETASSIEPQPQPSLLSPPTATAAATDDGHASGPLISVTTAISASTRTPFSFAVRR